MGFPFSIGYVKIFLNNLTFSDGVSYGVASSRRPVWPAAAGLEESAAISPISRAVVVRCFPSYRDHQLLNFTANAHAAFPFPNRAGRLSIHLVARGFTAPLRSENAVMSWCKDPASP